MTEQTGAAFDDRSTAVTNHASGLSQGLQPHNAQSGLRGLESSGVAASLMHIPVTLQVVLGTARMALSRIADLRPGSVVNLDQKLGTPATILVNGRAMAKGNLFVLDGDDARLGITITEVTAAGAPFNPP